MSCREHEADIVELARGAGLDAEAEARLRGHLTGCAGCAALLAREQRMTSALREVAEAAPQPSGSDAIEAQLLQAFAAQHADESRRASSSRRPVTVRPAWGWLAAAAVLVLAAVLWRGTDRWRSPDGAAPVPPDLSSAPADTLAAAPTAAGPAPRRDRVTIPAPLRDAPPQTAPGRAPAARRPAQAAARAGDDEVLRFVSLPAAIGLPAFESGRIVRVELASAVLPAFGFDVVPGSESGVVEADLLIGQDDQPRAIRFVDLKTDSRRRQ
jgi:hypothetical protein